MNCPQYPLLSGPLSKSFNDRNVSPLPKSDSTYSVVVDMRSVYC